MRLFLTVALLLSGVLDFTLGSTLKHFPDMNTEEALKFLYEKILSLENRETPDLTQKIKGEVKDELTAKLAEMEASFVNKHNDLSTKQQELEENASEQKEYLNELSERFLKEKEYRLSMDNHILMEVHQLQKRELETVEKINTLKNEVTFVSEGGCNKTDMLEDEIHETKDLVNSCLSSLQGTDGAILQNMSSSVEILKTLTNHTSEISSINARLIRVENRCSDPPDVENGHPMDSGLGGRDHEGVVTYACRGDKVPAGNDTLTCLYGKWTGELPRCVDPVCDPPCENGGGCLKNNFCRCTPPFGGDRCQNDYSKCGVDFRNVDGNRSTDSPAWPWMAAVHRKENSFRLRCGGSIIHQQFILTSARCLQTSTAGGRKLDATDLTVRLGLTDTRDLTHLQEHNVRTIHVHPLYNRSYYRDNAIALLELEEPIDYDLFIRPVCLPQKETPEDNQLYEPQSSVHVIVWRWDVPNFTLRSYVIQPADNCNEYFGRFGVNLTDRVFCTNPEGHQCSHTEGGSVAMHSRPDGRGGRVWTQVGVGGHFGLTCRRGDHGILYSLFNRLQQLMAWVEETVEGAASVGG